MKYIVIDLETLATSQAASIVAIGAAVVEYMPQHGWILSDALFYIPADVTESGPEYEIAPATVVWWMQQSDAARSVFSKPNVHIAKVLVDFGCWLRLVTGGQPFKMWGMPSRLDIAVLDHALQVQGLATLWDHRDVLDLRTLIHVRDPNGEHMPVHEGEAHNALDDARWQARYLAALLPDPGAIL